MQHSPQRALIWSIVRDTVQNKLQSSHAAQGVLFSIYKLIIFVLIIISHICCQSAISLLFLKIQTLCVLGKDALHKLKRQAVAMIALANPPGIHVTDATDYLRQRYGEIHYSFAPQTMTFINVFGAIGVISIKIFWLGTNLLKYYFQYIL